MCREVVDIFVPAKEQDFDFAISIWYLKGIVGFFLEESSSLSLAYQLSLRFCVTRSLDTGGYTRSKTYLSWDVCL